MKKPERITSLLILCLFVALTTLPFLNTIVPTQNAYTMRNMSGSSPKSAGTYVNSQTGTGLNYNVTLQQSFHNTSITTVNTTITGNHTISVPCPMDVNFNSSLINISMNNIVAPNKTLDFGQGGSATAMGTSFWGFEFYVQGRGYFQNISLYLQNQHTTNPTTVGADLYGGSWDGLNSIFIPNQFIATLGTQTIPALTTEWVNYTTGGNPILLDPHSSQAQANIYFIVIYKSGISGTPRYFYTNADPGQSNITYSTDGITWYDQSRTQDASMVITMVPFSNTPNATSIALKVNSINATDIGFNDGLAQWVSTINLSNSTGFLTFDFSAEWWDVQLNINNILINYTRTNNLASSSYEMNVNDPNAYWNVTWAAVNFTGGFENYLINVSLPGDWVVDSAQNSSEARSFSTYLRGDGWQDVKIFDAWNGTFWNITAHVANWLSDLKFTEDLVNYVSVINSTDIVNITAIMKSPVSLSVSKGVNVSIYSPIDISQELNFTYVNESTSSAVKNINLSWWDVSNTVKEYGQFRAQAFWINGTHIGYIEKPLTILGVSTMIKQEPLSGVTKFVYDSLVPGTDRFNLTVYVTDTILGTPINDMDIAYNYDGNPFGGNLTLNGTAGTYNLTIHLADVGFGTHTAYLRANNTWFNNQTLLSYTFEFWNQTSQSIQGSDTQTKVNGETASFNAVYQFSDGSAPIVGATFTCSNASFQPSYVYSGGVYTVTFDTSWVDGSKNAYHLEFNLSRNFNTTQTYNVFLYVQNKTVVSDLTLDQWSDFGYNHVTYTTQQTGPYYGSTADVITAYYGASFNVTARYYDRNNSRGIVDSTGSVTYANLTISGVPEIALISITTDGNYSAKVTTLLAPGDYAAWVKFNDADAWNATYRNFTIRILAVPTTNNTIGVSQPNYPGAPITQAGNDAWVFYGADLRITWQMNVNLGVNGTAVAGQALNGSLTGQFDVANFMYKPVGTYNLDMNLTRFGYNNRSVTLTIHVLPCNITSQVEMWQYGYKNGTVGWGPYVGENISIGVHFINAFNGSYLTAVDLLAFNFGGEINNTGNTWLNVDWFNGSLNASAKPYGNYQILVNMTTANYWFQNVTIDLYLHMTPTEITNVVPNQGGSNLDYDSVAKYYTTSDTTSSIIITYHAQNFLSKSPLSDGTLTLYMQRSDGSIILLDTSYITKEILGAGDYKITLKTDKFPTNEAFKLIANFTRTDYENSTNTVISLYIRVEGGIDPRLIIAAAAIGGIVALFALIYVGPIKKGKKRKQDELLTTASAFEDAINLQHILVIYKNTGTCIYFKSFAREAIDPDLISGFLQAVSTFGTEMKVEQALDEMKYGDSVLLLNDGELLRVTLVLSKSPSSVLRANLGRFTITFEETFREKLANWRGQLGIFEGADDLVDNLLNASIILPHEVGDVKGLKLVKSVLGRGVLKIAQQMSSGERKFFFLASLVSDSAESMKRPPAEILLAVDQLRKANVIRPIKMEQFKEKAVSAQELQLIRQQVQQLKVPQDQVEPMVQALSKMEPVEREAAIASMKQGKQITTDLTAQLGEIKKVGSPDEAAVEIKALEKKAKGLLKEKDFEKAMNSYRAAEVLAFQWNLKEDATRLREVQLSLEVDALKTTFAESMKSAKKAESKNPADALEAYKKAREIAQMLFKRGIATAEKDVVSLTTTIKKMESSTSTTEVATTIQGTKKDLLGERKDLLGQVKALENQEMWAKLQKVYLRLEQISNELYKMGDMAEAKNVKLYRKQAMKYQDIVSALQQDQEGAKKE